MNLRITAGPLATEWACPEVVTETGAIVCLSGDNGAGKTTLLRGLNGTSACALTISFDGEELRRLSARQRVARGLCTLEPDRSEFSSLCVQEHLHLAAWPLAKSDKIAKTAEALQRWRLPPERLGRQLSGGERQRLLFARAEVLGPKILVVDEPFRHCDLTTADQVTQALQEWTRQGMSVLLLCHPESRALSLAQTTFQLSRSQTSTSRA